MGTLPRVNVGKGQLRMTCVEPRHVPKQANSSGGSRIATLSGFGARRSVWPAHSAMTRRGTSGSPPLARQYRRHVRQTPSLAVRREEPSRQLPPVRIFSHFLHPLMRQSTPSSVRASRDGRETTPEYSGLHPVKQPDYSGVVSVHQRDAVCQLASGLLFFRRRNWQWRGVLPCIP